MDFFSRFVSVLLSILPCFSLSLLCFCFFLSSPFLPVSFRLFASNYSVVVVIITVGILLMYDRDRSQQNMYAFVLRQRVVRWSSLFIRTSHFIWKIQRKQSCTHTGAHNTQQIHITPPHTHTHAPLQVKQYTMNVGHFNECCSAYNVKWALISHYIIKLASHQFQSLLSLSFSTLHFIFKRCCRVFSFPFLSLFFPSAIQLQLWIFTF